MEQNPKQIKVTVMQKLMNHLARGIAFLLALLCFSCHTEEFDDYVSLQEDSNTGMGAGATSNAEVDVLISEGLKVFRKEGIIQEGAACANCHAPDGLDIAYFNFSERDIKRRIEPHLTSPADMDAILGLIRGLKEKYSFDHKDPMVDRPFQPKGYVLAGNTPQERDLTFGRQLVDMNFRFANIPILDKEEAMRQKQEWLGVNPRDIAIGIPLNRWSEDPHKGDEHATIADWLPDLPRLPKSDTWYAIQDEYLADPTDENLIRMLDAVDDHTFQNFSGNGRKLMTDKYKSVLAAQHIFREEVSGRRYFVDRPSVAFYPAAGVGRDNTINDVWQVGDFARIFERRTVSLPGDVQERISPNSTMREELRKIRVPWFWSGWLFDTSLRKSCCGSTRSGEYFTRFLNEDFRTKGYGRSGYSLHNVYMITKKIVTDNFDPSVTMQREAIPNSEFPPKIKYTNFNRYDRDWQWGPESHETERAALYDFMVGNSYRLMMYLMQDEILTKGFPEDKYSGRVDDWLDELEKMKKFFSQRPTEYNNFNMELYRDTKNLILSYR